MMMKPEQVNVLVAFEFSAIVRDAFRARGFNAWSCDLRDTEGDPRWHLKTTAKDAMKPAGPWDFTAQPSPWHLIVAHPPCTRLSNAGRRWLHNPPKGSTMVEMWTAFFRGVTLYASCRGRTPFVAIENPIWHDHAREALGDPKRHFCQPYWFGDKLSKRTGWELENLPPLEPTNMLTPPREGEPEYAEWQKIHRMSPGPEREKERSRFHPGMAKAMAEQWGDYVLQQLESGLK